MGGWPIFCFVGTSEDDSVDVVDDFLLGHDCSLTQDLTTWGQEGHYVAQCINVLAKFKAKNLWQVFGSLCRTLVKKYK